MQDLDRIPYDIWHLIFDLVCTDGGYSGCSLALASKALRALSAPARFNSLTLYSLTEVKNVLICIERIRRFERASSDSVGSIPPIHNLLLSFLPDTCLDVPKRTIRKWTSYARDERALVFQLVHDHRAWEQAKTIWNRDFILYVSRLLQLAAPTLRTLVLLQSGDVRLPLLRVPLPALRELTLLADDRLFLRVAGPGALVSGQNDPSDFVFYGVPAEPHPSPAAADDPPFPALTHLHIVYAGPKLHPWERTLPRWATLAPALSHLRVSQGNERLPRLLGEMLGVSPVPTTPLEDAEAEAAQGGADAAAAAADARGGAAWRGAEALHQPPTSPFPSVQVVIVQMCGARKNNDALDPTLRELERITDACELGEREGSLADGPRPRLVVLRSRAYEPGYWDMRLQWEWTERMLGGGGCWREDESDESAWKVFERAGREARDRTAFIKKGPRAVLSLVDVRDGMAEDTGARPVAKRWWRVLAKIPRPKRRSMIY